MKTRLITLALLLTAFGLYTWNLDADSLWRDEALSILRADQPLNLLMRGRNIVQGVDTADLHPPLYFLLLKIQRTLTGTSIFAGRYLTVLTMLLAVATLSRTAQTIIGKRAGLATLLLTVAAPFSWWYAQETRMYAQVVLMSSLFLLAWWHLLKRDRLADYARFGLATLLLFATHYMSIFLIGAAIAILLLRRFNVRLLLVSLTVGAIALFFLRDSIFTVLGGDFRFFTGRPIPVLIREPLTTFWLGTTDPPLFSWYVFAPFILLFLCGIVIGLRNPEYRLFTAAYLLTILLIYAAGFLYANYSNPRHLTALMPLIFLITGAGLAWLWQRTALIPVTIGVLAVPFFVAWQQTIVEPPQVRDDVAGLQAYLEPRVRPGDLILWHDPDVSVTWDFYELPDVRQTTLPRIKQSPEAGGAELASFIGAVDRVWFVEVRERETPVSARVREWERVSQWQFAGSWIFPRVTLYRNPEKFISTDTVQYDGVEVEQNFVTGEGVWVDVATAGIGGKACVGLLDASGKQHTPETCAPVLPETGEKLMLWMPLSTGMPPIAYQLFVEGDERRILDTVQIETESAVTRTEVDWLSDRFTAGQWAIGSVVWSVAPGRDESGVKEVRLVDGLRRQVGDVVRVEAVSAEYPPSQWQPGETLRANFAVQLPFDAQGNHKLQIRFLDSNGGVWMNGWTTIGEIPIEPFPLVTDLPPDVVPLPENVAFGEAITLEAATIERESEQVFVTLFWRGEGGISAEYLTFIHLSRPGEPPVAQAGGIPVGFSRPTTSWRKNELLTDSYTITLPENFDPTGYQIAIGLYDPANNNLRLPANGNPDGIYFLGAVP